MAHGPNIMLKNIILTFYFFKIIFFIALYKGLTSLLNFINIPFVKKNA